MAKNLKLRIKNTQIAKALNLGDVKDKVAKKKAEKAAAKEKAPEAEAPEEVVATPPGEGEAAEAPKRVIRARTKSAFESEEETSAETSKEPAPEEESAAEPEAEAAPEPEVVAEAPAPVEEAPAVEEKAVEPAPPVESEAKESPKEEPKPVEKVAAPKEEAKPKKAAPARPAGPARPKLGPTGRHVRDLLPKKPPAPKAEAKDAKEPAAKKAEDKGRPGPAKQTEADNKRGGKGGQKPGSYRDFKSTKQRRGGGNGFDGRDRRGLRAGEEDGPWRRRRPKKGAKAQQEDTTIRPSELSIRLPIPLKELAAEMKLKASQLIAKLFMQGVVVTLNDLLDDETTVLLLGEEFDCKITIDTSEEERIRITDKTVLEEIAEADPANLENRAPIVAFMGHVDHGKTSLIDAIRETNVVAGEAGAITQHIGAFLCTTSHGPIAFLDTPGHEAFSAMRMRGAELTDIVVLVVAGDEGMRDQTIEAIKHAKAAGVTIVVAINKCDKEGFNAENVYRQLSEHELLPEAWGGQTITVNTSATTKEGIKELLEMLSLQSEVLELKADPTTRARGSVVETEMHKGLGQVATVMVQNGTLRTGDCIVFGHEYARIRTMRDDHGRAIQSAGPATPVRITGLSGMPEAGEEFIAVKDEAEARSIAEARHDDKQYERLMAKKATTIESLLSAAAESQKKVLHVILRADMQGSLEAMKEALLKIKSDKVSVNIVSEGVGAISESDVDLAGASKAVILGFHTQVESHAEPLVKEHGVKICLHDIIYHAVDEVKDLMAGLLDKTEEYQDTGEAEVQLVFKVSSLGNIAGCLVTSGKISRNNSARLIRDGEVIWTGPIASLKRVKEDVKEVKSGLECGILLSDSSQVQEGDKIVAFETIYIKQEL